MFELNSFYVQESRFMGIHQFKIFKSEDESKNPASGYIGVFPESNEININFALGGRMGPTQAVDHAFIVETAVDLLIAERNKLITKEQQ